MADAGTSASEHVTALVRGEARPRYLASLFAPDWARPALLALAAFDLETARIPLLVHEPMAGEIRLQWWRDALAAPAGVSSGHPVADPLRAAIERWRLPLTAFEAFLEARTADLYDDAFPDMASFEGYAGETSGALVQLGAIVLAGGEDPGTGTAAGHAGVALALGDLFAGVPRAVARHRLPVPADLAKAFGIDPEALFAGGDQPGLGVALGELRRRAVGHLDRVAALLPGLPSAVVPAFLPLAALRPRLAGMASEGWDPLRSVVRTSPLVEFWRVWRAARRPGRI